MQARFMQGISREEYFQAHFTMTILDIAHFNFFTVPLQLILLILIRQLDKIQFYSTFLVILK